MLTGFGRGMRLTERAARAPARRRPTCSSSTSTSPRSSSAVAAELRSRWGGLDGVLHAIAFAPADALGGGFLDTPASSAITAFQTSAFSLKALAAALAPLLEARRAAARSSASTSTPRVAWPVYDWMGVAKAALESVSRYLARDLGPRGVRVNLVSAGPIETIAAGGIPGFDELAGLWRAGAPLGWDTRDAAPVARGRVLPAERPRARDHRRDPPRRRRLPRDGRAAAVSETVLLTGATGFLGMELLARLIERERHRGDLPRPRAVRGGRRGAARRRSSTRLYEELPAAAGAGQRRCAGDVAVDDLGLARARPRRRSLERVTQRDPLRGVDLVRPARSRRRAQINTGGALRMLELSRELAARGRLRRHVHVSTAYVAGRYRGRFTRDRPRRRPGLPQHLRAVEVRGRARDRRGRRRAAARDRAAEHHRRRQPQRLDLGVQRHLLADARVLARADGRGRDRPRRRRRHRAGRLRRGRRCSRCCDADDVERHASRSSPARRRRPTPS